MECSPLSLLTVSLSEWSAGDRHCSLVSLIIYLNGEVILAHYNYTYVFLAFKTLMKYIQTCRGHVYFHGYWNPAIFIHPCCLNSITETP